MKIISWNLFCFNFNPISSIEALLEYNPDVFCLQEVSEFALNYLRRLDAYYIHVALDFYTPNPKLLKKAPYYLVTGIKKSVCTIIHSASQEELCHNQTLSLLAKRAGWEESREFQWVDCELLGTRYRIINCHLELAVGPNLRLKQFKQILNRIETDDTKIEHEPVSIISGDFNIFASPWLNWLVGWLFGFDKTELRINERTLFDELCYTYGFINPLRGNITFPRTRLQLDHILLTKNQIIKHSGVITKRNGSDHYPIEVTLS